jgi:hypothetical protein
MRWLLLLSGRRECVSPEINLHVESCDIFVSPQFLFQRKRSSAIHHSRCLLLRGVLLFPQVLLTLTMLQIIALTWLTCWKFSVDIKNITFVLSLHGKQSCGNFSSFTSVMQNAHKERSYSRTTRKMLGWISRPLQTAQQVEYFCVKALWLTAYSALMFFTLQIDNTIWICDTVFLLFCITRKAVGIFFSSSFL